MLLTRESISELKENDLRRRVLIPLFVAMGYRDVRELHGATEYGKDIVMWRADPIASRRNVAVVVKAVKIYSRNRKEVAGQVSEAFEISYDDPVTGATQMADKVLVITSGPFSDSAQKALRARFAPRPVECMDGDLLAQRASEFLVKEIVWEALLQAQQVLAAELPDFKTSMSTDPEKVSLSFDSKSADPAKLEGAMQLVFGDSEDGEGVRSGWEEFVREGTPLTLSNDQIASFSPPVPFKALSGEDFKVTEIHLGGTALEEPLLASLELVLADGLNVSLDYIHFSKRYGGTDGVTLTNEEQPIPFQVRVRFDKLGGDSNFDIGWDLDEDADALTLYRVLLLQRANKVGATVIFRHWETGTPIFIAKKPPSNSDGPSGPQVEFARRAALVQVRAGVVLQPLLEESRDPGDLEWAVQALERGRVRLATGTTVRISTTLSAAPSEEGPWKFRYPVSEREKVEVMGKTVPLGKAYWTYEGPADTQQVPSEDGVTVIATSTEECPMFVEYSEVFTTSPTAANHVVAAPEESAKAEEE